MEDNMDDVLDVGVLQLILDQEEVDPYLYRIGGYADESLCIEKIDGKWAVYGGDRGERFDVSLYDSEDEACRAFLERIEDYI